MNPDLIHKSTQIKSGSDLARQHRTDEARLQEVGEQPDLDSCSRKSGTVLLSRSEHVFDCKGDLEPIPLDPSQSYNSNICVACSTQKRSAWGSQRTKLYADAMHELDAYNTNRVLLHHDQTDGQARSGVGGSREAERAERGRCGESDCD